MLSQRLTALLLASPVLSAQQFGPEVDLAPVAALATAAQFVDYDGDGDLDVLWTTGGANNVILYETLEDNRFSTGRLLVPGSQDIGSALLHDFDGDGLFDLVAAGYGVTVAPGEPDWTFGIPATISSTNSLFLSLGLADLNGDGLMDIYGRRSAPPGLTWYENQGAGAFAPPADISMAPGDKDELVDMDGDGDLDFLTLDGALGTLTVHLNNASGALWSSTIIASGLSSISQLTVGDVDTDGDIDIGIASQQLRTLFWIEQQSAGTFGAPQLIRSLSGSPTGLVFADPRGSGTLDIVTTLRPNTGSSEAVLMRGAGDGTFAAPVQIAEFDFLFGLPNGIVAPDVDQDGDDDLFTLSLGRSYFIAGDPQGPLASTDFPESSLDAVELASADFDGDGTMDLVANQDLGRQIRAYLNRGDGRSFRPVTLDDGLARCRSVHAQDWDGDGVADVVASIDFAGADFQINWYRGDGAGGFEAPSLIASGSHSLAESSLLEPGDMDADGDLDWLYYEWSASGSTFRWLRNDGQGVYASGPQSPVTSPGPFGSEVLDMDADGDADLLAWDRFSGLVYWRENLGTGSLGPDQVIVPQGSPALWSVKPGDFDGDGDADVAVSVSGGRLYWALNSGSGFAIQPDITTYPPAVTLWVGDLDADGDVDLAVSGVPPQVPPGYLLNGGDGMTWTPVDLDVGPGRTAHVMQVDLDGDSDLDLVKAHGQSVSTRSIRANFNTRRIGIGFCGNAVPSSTGESAVMAAEGSLSVASNNLTLIAESMPAFSFGIFRVSRTSDFLPLAGGSQGNLCLGGSVGNFNRPGELFSTRQSGSASLALDLSNWPQPLGPVSVQPGDTWFVQSWFRDSSGTQPTSNFSGGLRLGFVY